ncbi:uncharacterized protein LOC113147219 [Cyclospora cayetanensis]|uniref:DNA 3'-5' helicase n=1 Tax=Cyclospora cayetanensis TaxID=88456 RepID=A0A6P6S0E1_9EIME|nr:uncharacterized protein LOC113147219 [Cyclospora cayetanensis]
MQRICAPAMSDNSQKARVGASPTPPSGLVARTSSGVDTLELPQHGTLFGLLSPDQARVVAAPPESSVCVLAGPGAGKTTTITARVIRLLLLGRQPLAALTFTKKSALELERRIRGGLESLRGVVGGSQDVQLFVGTFHGFFAQLLRDHGRSVGVPGGFRVLGPVPQLVLLRSLILEEKKRQEAHLLPSGGERSVHAHAPATPIVEGDAGVAFSTAARDAEELRRRIRSMKCIPEVLERERTANSVVYRLFCAYESHLRRHKPPLLDFTDLVTLAIRLLEQAETRHALRARWPYLVVDEFQDTNSKQFKFLCLLRLMTPNDRLHTSIFHDYRSRFPAYQEFVLGCNYRSVPLVVRHSGALIRFNWPFRLPKTLYAACTLAASATSPSSCSRAKALQNSESPSLAALKSPLVRTASQKDNNNASGGFVAGAFLATQTLEAQYILRFILCLKQHAGLRWDDFAILCRTNGALKDVHALISSHAVQREASAPTVGWCFTSSTHAAASCGVAARPLDPNSPLDPAFLFPSVDVSRFNLPAGGIPLTAPSSLLKSSGGGGAELFLRPDALDVLAYLRLAVDPHHDASFVRALNKPQRRIGSKTLLWLRRVLLHARGEATEEASFLAPNAKAEGGEMPWQGLFCSAPRDVNFEKTAGGRGAQASLFSAMCAVLQATSRLNEEAGSSGEDALAGFASNAPAPAPLESFVAAAVQAIPQHVAAAAKEAASRLRTNQLDALAAFFQALCRLHRISRSAVPVTAVIGFLLGPLRLGVFFGERGKAQLKRAPESRTPEKATTAAAAGGCCDEEDKTRKDELGEPPSFTDAKATLKELAHEYGLDSFADVHGLLRAVEAYTPNWQQKRAADCICCLLQDAAAGRFLQQKVVNAITLSTIHQAKGLEWQAVIIARANDGTLPMGASGSQPLADFVSRVLLGTASASQGRPSGAGEQQALVAETLARAEEAVLRQGLGNEQHLHLMEERRVCYVAMTRAKRFILMTAPLADKNNHPIQPSRFFGEAGLVVPSRPQSREVQASRGVDGSRKSTTGGKETTHEKTLKPVAAALTARAATPLPKVPAEWN